MIFLYCEIANVYFSYDDMTVHMAVEKDLSSELCCLHWCSYQIWSLLAFLICCVLKWLNYIKYETRSKFWRIFLETFSKLYCSCFSIVDDNLDWPLTTQVFKLIPLIFFCNPGLSLLEYPGIKPIDPAYALPVDVVNRVMLGR